MSTAAETFATPGFGPENLPYGSYRVGQDQARLGVRLGDRVVDLAKLAGAVGGLSDDARAAVDAPNLDALLAAGAGVWKPLREWIVAAVAAADSTAAVEQASTPVADVELLMPFTVADYVDYYASEHHASNVGKMFRPDQEPLLPNWKNLPVGYHGRSGTVIPSGRNIPRPKGLRPEQNALPSYGPSRRLDIEAEMGFVLGGAAPTGEVSLTQAAQEHIFGVVIFNDWSARDIQAYEYVPLGPYLGKSFASSISLWVVPWDALDAAKVPTPARDNALASYLDDSQAPPYGLDVTMEVLLDGHSVSHPPVKHLYWSAPQMVAHMTVNNATLRPGDFFGSGTVSGPEREQRGSFLELSWSGKEPFDVGGKETTFLEDGHTVTIKATAPGANGSLIDFGECTATILPPT